MIKLETQQQKFGQIWIIQLRAVIFQTCYPRMIPSQGHFATICDVTTVQLSNGTLHTFHKIVLFSKMHLPSTL